MHLRASAEKSLGGRGPTKKDRKIAKKTENSTIKPLPERGATEKSPKNSKNGRT